MGGVFAVHHDEIEIQLAAQFGHLGDHRLAAGASHDITEEKKSHSGVLCGSPAGRILNRKGAKAPWKSMFIRR